MNSSRTLWMGNIESWMNEAFIISIFNSINIKPTGVVLKNKELKIGFCFIEFDSYSTAYNVLKKYNGAKINNFILKLNWKKEPMKYTIYVGNLPKATTTEEVTDYFKKLFPSVTGIKLINDPMNKKSKCYGFVDFIKYNEYQMILSSNRQYTYKGNQLIINSAKLRKEEETAIESEFFSIKRNSHSSDNSSNSTQSSKGSCTTSSYPNKKQRKEEEEFVKSIQKGLRDVIDIYNRCNCKAILSYQCNYHCNLIDFNNSL